MNRPIRPRDRRRLALLTLLLTLIACQSVQAPAPITTPAAAQATAVPAPTDAPLPATSSPVPTATSSTPANAADANVRFVSARQGSDGRWTFTVTVAHPDTGWDDYADGWDVLLPDGTILKINPADSFTRLLLHPHENEQPFTRSQGGLTIPDDVTAVIVRAHDLVDGYGGREVTVDLTRSEGPDFQVQR